MAGSVSTVDPEAGRAAADIIKAAVRDHVPVLRVSKAAALAGITDVGWHRAIKTGRGYESTFIAMARVAGVEPAVREALGLPPLDENVVPLSVPRTGGARDAYERRILASDLPQNMKDNAIKAWRAPGCGRDILIAAGIDLSPLERSQEA